MAVGADHHVGALRRQCLQYPVRQRATLIDDQTFVLPVHASAFSASQYAGRDVWAHALAADVAHLDARASLLRVDLGFAAHLRVAVLSLLPKRMQARRDVFV